MLGILKHEYVMAKVYWRWIRPDTETETENRLG